MLKLKHYRDRASGLADLLNYAAVVADGVVLGKDGSLLGGWYYQGDDVDSATPDELNAMSARINAALVKLGSGWMIQVDAVRLAADAYPMPERSFPVAVAQKIDDERRSSFTRVGSQFDTSYILLVTYLPPKATESRLFNLLIDDPAAKDDKQDLATKHLAHFEHVLASIESDLASVLRMQRIKSDRYQDSHGKVRSLDRLLQYINFAVTGINHPVHLPPCPMYIDSLLGWQDLEGGLSPKIGDKYLAAVALDGLPQESYPTILSGLDQFAGELRWHTRFIALDQQEALAHLKAYRRKWQQKVRGFVDQLLQNPKGALDHNAISMVDEADSAIATAESGLAAFGYYTSLIVVLDEDREALAMRTKAVTRFVQDLGFTCRTESVNALEAWLGSLPSHGVQNVRRPLIHTINLADLLPASSVWAGAASCPSPLFPPASPPLMLAVTGGSTPFRLNLHVGDLGHTLIVGPTGSGKSTLLATIAAQFLRYKDASIFAFDKGNSLFPLTMGLGGLHYDIAGEGSGLNFCPLSRIAESKAEQMWAEDWVSSLCELQGIKVTPNHRQAIHKAMRLLAKAHSKSITDFSATLQDCELTGALQHYTVSGAMGTLLDATEDALKFCRFQVYEIETLMSLGDRNCLPVLDYLFHRVETSLKGKPSLLIIDEAWLPLKHPVFREKIREWLKVLRKANVAVILATQSISDAANSGILDVIAESCPTKIYLANANAKDQSAVHFYKTMGLNDRQIDIIASMTPKRQYYAVSPEGRRVFELGLGPYSLRYVGTSGKEAMAELKDLIARYPDSWRPKWEERTSV